MPRSVPSHPTQIRTSGVSPQQGKFLGSPDVSDVERGLRTTEADAESSPVWTEGPAWICFPALGAMEEDTQTAAHRGACLPSEGL